jgi:hypothetical protein
MAVYEQEDWLKVCGVAKLPVLLPQARKLGTFSTPEEEEWEYHSWRE